MTVTAPQKLALFPNGNPKPDQAAAVTAAHERLRDRHPEELTAEDFASLATGGATRCP